MYAPSPAATAVFVSPPGPVSATVAPGTTAPLSSVTVPSRVALCARNEAALDRISRSEAASLTNSILLPSPQIVQCHSEVKLKAKGAGVYSLCQRRGADKPVGV